MALHSALTGTDLHEPKGVAAASSGQIYVANGSGSGTWTTLNYSDIGQKDIYFSVVLEDVSTASTVYIPCPVAGTITEIMSVIDGAISTADANITSRINGVAITNGGLTIANASSAAGDIDTATPTALNTVADGDYISIETDGASTGTVKATFVITIRLS